MTGREVLTQAFFLLNYTSPHGDINSLQNAELLHRSVPVLNMVLADLLPIEGKEITSIKDIGEELPVSETTAMAVMPYGVAMFYAQSENDGDNQQLMARLYNQKRIGIRPPSASVQDTVVVPEL